MVEQEASGAAAAAASSAGAPRSSQPLLFRARHTQTENALPSIIRLRSSMVSTSWCSETRPPFRSVVRTRLTWTVDRRWPRPRQTGTPARRNRHHSPIRWRADERTIRRKRGQYGRKRCGSRRPGPSRAIEPSNRNVAPRGFRQTRVT